MLTDICDIIDVDNEKELAIWVSLLFGYNLFLRKSNLAPLSRTHEPQFQISRRDIRFHDGILITFIKWSKINQFGEKPLYLPMVINQKSEICPVKWCMFMVHRIPAHAHHNLFCFRENGQTLPITYYDLNMQLHKWLSKIGITNYHQYSSHLLHRGGASEAFENGVPEVTIKMLGNWASEAYRRYIDCTLTSRLKAWMVFNHF